VRVELLGRRVLYGVRSAPGAGGTLFVPAGEIVRAAERLAAAAELDAGSVEYLVDDRDGAPRFTGVHARFNLLQDPASLIGFDPVETLADYLASRVATTPFASTDQGFDRSG
jgi:hypothetical protein